MTTARLPFASRPARVGRRREPDDGEVRLWQASLDDPPIPRARLVAVLSDDERARAGRFAFDRDRDRWTTARALLRFILADELDVSPERLRFGYGARGKPHLSGRGHERPRFSVAHSGGVALFALSRRRDVGVDVEHERADIAATELWDVAHTVLSPSELAALEPMAPEARRREFFRLWVRKEAYLKATGEGFQLAPASVTVLGPVGEPLILRAAAGGGTPEPWTIADVPAAPGLPAAVAVRGVGLSICRGAGGASGPGAIELERLASE